MVTVQMKRTICQLLATDYKSNATNPDHIQLLNAPIYSSIFPARGTTANWHLTKLCKSIKSQRSLVVITSLKWHRGCYFLNRRKNRDLSMVNNLLDFIEFCVSLLDHWIHRKCWYSHVTTNWEEGYPWHNRDDVKRSQESIENRCKKRPFDWVRRKYIIKKLTIVSPHDCLYFVWSKTIITLFN